MYVALVLLLRKQILQKSPPPPCIHVSCQRMCVQEGVSDILATPVKGWKMKNSPPYNGTQTSIIHNCEQGGCVRHILATPVKGWKMKNTPPYDGTQTSIFTIVYFEPKYWLHL